MMRLEGGRRRAGGIVEMTSTKEKPKRVRSYRFSLSGISPDKKRLSEGLPERGDADGQHD